MKRRGLCISICLILKYLFAMLFPILAAAVHKMTWRYIAVALAEVVLIAFVTNLLCRVKSWLGYLFNVPALLFMNVQFAVLYWGSTFVSAVMLANLDSINAISGKFLVYGFSVVSVLVFSFLPVGVIPGNKKTTFALGTAAAVLYIGVIFTGIIEYSPYRAAYMLYQQAERSRMAEDAVAEAMSGMVVSGENESQQEQEENEFYSDSVADYFAKPEEISENPNVILIFAEGMSQNIIDDTRNIMPNVSALQDKSIYFANYYNHTFATYMGLSGQLYSDYQRENYDANPLVSVQDIFRDYGYKTAFINTEPENKEFSEYLANFGFEELLADKSRVDGMADALSDKSAYEMLFETALEQNADEIPFFLAMYSFGTHATLDGVYEEFAGGSNALLNRFYDLDVQIGSFLKRFDESELAENTIIILTSDHAAYQDADFVTAFPDYMRKDPSLDRIPFMIYYKGVTPKRYDAGGRNSLDMAPTILDFLDMSAPNYFWGDSLFAIESGSLYDTYFESMGICYCTTGGEANLLSAEQMQEFEKRLAKYYALKLSDNLIYEEYEEAEHVYARVNEEQTVITVELYNGEEWDMLNYALWSEEGEQDDLQWFSVPGNHENYSAYELDLSGYERKGVYFVHVYGSMEGDEEMTFLGEARVNIEK
ncbi:MAG: sulfatase-like hydrolase/transferase [Lachnospiraceae bacterium]|nr:sulfatase-like hydrolase/transferase [Lachnospiraceae bacterium]